MAVVKAMDVIINAFLATERIDVNMTTKLNPENNKMYSFANAIFRKFTRLDLSIRQKTY